MLWYIRAIMDELDTLLTTRQLQRLLQVDRITIYRMLQDGRLEGFKVGGQWRFSRRSIGNWLKERQADLDVSELPATAEDIVPGAQALPLYCIQMVQDIFAEVLNVGIITTALDGTPLTSLEHSCEFCHLVLGTPAGRERCIHSWQAAAATPGPTPQPALCHAGLRYIWGRTKVRGRFVAATYAGQFLLQSPDQDEGWPRRLEELGMATGIKTGELQKALAQVPVLDEDQQRQATRLLQRLTDTFSEMGKERLSLLSRLQRIAEISTL
jgi:excisionase family DNA binding protein